MKVQPITRVHNKKMSDSIPFGKILKRLMRESRIPVKELSQEIGVPVSTINQWVYGRTPRLDAGLLRLARFFNVSLEYLVAGVEREANLTDPIKLLEDTILKVNHRQYRIILEPIVRSAEKKKEE